MRWPVALLPLGMLAAFGIQVQNWPLTLLTGLMLVLQMLWIMTCLLRPAGIVPAVLGSIAGFSLLDAFLLGILGAPLPAVIAVCCFGVVTIIHRPLPGHDVSDSTKPVALINIVGLTADMLDERMPRLRLREVLLLGSPVESRSSRTDLQRPVEHVDRQASR